MKQNRVVSFILLLTGAGWAAGAELARSLNNLGAQYFHSGRYADAEPLYRRALEAWKNARPESPRDVALTLNNLGALYRAQGRYREAEPLYLESLRLLGEASGAPASGHALRQSERRQTHPSLACLCGGRTDRWVV